MSYISESVLRRARLTVTLSVLRCLEQVRRYAMKPQIKEFASALVWGGL
jgi:hypothetical protein